MRNRQSARTLFSIFCRKDDVVSDRATCFVDLGANVGIAAAYFLSLHPASRVLALEPDPGNEPILLENMKQFGSRFTYDPRTVHIRAGEVDLYCSGDGKYSTVFGFGHRLTWPKVRVPCVSMREVCRRVVQAAGSLPIVVKVDVEGLEPDLIASIDFTEFPFIEVLLVESKARGELVDRPHSRTLRNGCVEHLTFT